MAVRGETILAFRRIVDKNSDTDSSKLADFPKNPQVIGNAA
jgi:hypothetical protein